ncbi:MAG: non-canonical purine NTP pyrophosphatase, RdgB/HAM1 family [Odoribacter sp.]|nr:non-canonical purine NTP pyrophosphatase, RdgB/HAM1 family [Odoribacter sp.]
MKIVFATNNEHKLTEIMDLLGDSFTLLSLKDINIREDISEDFPTLEGNALFKAKFIHNVTGMNVFADDTGLEIESLNGLPGVHSARFAGADKDFSANTEKVLILMKGKKNRRARFRSVIALILNGSEYFFEGIVQGTIINDKRGSGGFGYDPIFVPQGEKITLAEMSLNEKNRISHRALAFGKLKLFLSQYNTPYNKAIN